MKNAAFLLIGIFIQISLFAQYSVKVGNENSGTSSFEPCNNQYEYGWSATVYKQSDIQSHGQITDIYYKSQLFGGFGPGANTFMTNQRIFMKLVTDNEMTSNNFPDTSQMTLVYTGTVEFLNYQLANIHLNIPFDLDENHNLMILYINKNGIAQTDNNYFLIYPAEHNHTPNNTVFNNGNGSLPSNAGNYTADMPVVYLRYSSGLDVGISSVNEDNNFVLPQQADLTCKFRNYMADTVTATNIEWKSNGLTQTIVNWTGNNYCGQESSPVILQNNYAFAPGQYTIKANTTNPNGSTDELNTNDTLSFNFAVADNKRLAYMNYSGNTTPFLSNRRYGWSVSIYNKDSINFSGQIHSIAYYVNSPNGVIEPNQKIFIKTTSELTNTSLNYPDTNLFTKVFEGEIDYTSIGWHIIKLDTVFNYNNSENLMVLYENHAGKKTVQAIDFKVGWQGTNAVCNYDLYNFPTNVGTIATADRIPALKIYFSIPKDAGVTNLANSDVPVFTGNNNFVVDFKNFGLDTLQDVDIKYSIDENTTTSYHWTGTNSPQNEITNLNVGSSNLNYGDHQIKIWTENPNFLLDYANENDTFRISLRACTPMSGTYTIGNATSDFLTVKAAVDSLNNCGVNGAVTFNIKSGIYNSQYVLNNVWGVSSTNTITFESETGDSTDVVLTTDSTDFLLKYNATSYITFSNVTFSSDSALYFIKMDSTSSNINFLGNIFTSDTNIATYIYSSINFDNNNLFIENNLFENGNIAINLNYDNIEHYQSVISKNIFNSQNNKSIYADNTNHLNINENIFNTTSIGVELSICDYSNISKNQIILNNANKGIIIDNCLNIIIDNNFVSGNSTGLKNAGIYTTGYWTNTNSYKIAYNTVNMQSGDCAFYGNNIDSLWIFNNIFIDQTNQVIRLFPNYFVSSNNNCFYTGNSQFGSYNGSGNVSDLNNWITQTQNDSNSISALPYFYSNNDLHTQSLLIDNKGVPLNYINTDIDGETRDAVTPDIGADEFTSTCTGPLAGNYTVGTTGDYSNFNDAISTLYSCGISDTVTFNIEADIYNEQVKINGTYINYTNGIKPIKFISQSGNPDDVILKYDADTLNNFTLNIKDISKLTIDGITIQALDTSFGKVVNFENIVDSCIISNNIIEGVNTSNQTTCVSLNKLNEDSVMTITFTGNTINNGKDGISQIENNSTLNGLNLIINNNNFNNQRGKAIYSNNKTMLINNNSIVSNMLEYGVFTYFSDSLNISQNNISLTSDNSIGIKISNNAFISNNFISITNGNYGIWGSNSCTILNNTILLKTTNYYSSCIEIYGSPIIKNNCLINYNINIIHTNGSYSGFTMDYNNLYSNASYFNFTNTINTIGGNTHSISFMPDFVSDTDLHTNSALLYHNGTNLPEITEDIDGDIRNNPPCIGADEFDNPVFNAGNDTVFCYYDGYNINEEIYDIGMGYDTYQWSNGSDSSSIVIDTLHSVIGNNIYTVTVTIGSNTYSDTLNILYDLPTAITQTDYCISMGDSVNVCAYSMESYNWSTGDTTQCIYLDAMDYYGLITIEVTDIYACKNTETVNIQATFFPASFDLPTDTTICYDNSISIKANQYNQSDVYDKYSFLWSTGDTTQTITVDSLSFSVGVHEISVIVTNLETDLMCESYDTIFVELKNCNSVNDIENNSNISLSPNPAKNFIVITSEARQSIQNIEILDITGKTIIASKTWQSHSAKDTTIDISKLQNGIYFIKIIFDDNSLVTRKFIVKH